MLRKMLTNKKMLILIVAVILAIVGVLIMILIRNTSEEGEKLGVSINADKDKEGKDEGYNGEGLEVQDTLDESVYIIDGSGDWSTPSEGGNETDNASSENKPSDDAQSDNTQSNNTGQEESDNRVDDTEGELEEDILVDDKIWGEPN